MESKVVVVTGGGSGLGLALAEGLAMAGAHVHCLDQLESPVAAWHTARNAIAETSRGSLSYHQADVKDAGGLDQAITNIARAAGRLDGLITAAGVHQNIPALEYTTAAMDELLAVNYKGSFQSAVSCARQMIKYGCPGSICFISSISGFVANQGLTSSVYNSSKAAICQLTRNLAMEWGKVMGGKPIRVNAICPGALHALSE
ncbi:hypothetical protein H2200_001499 [Cladophialophora chaetospira]|uniref:Uncharacterized protein n=1 Tax=Cladophialophora chaetospira TaxID=386627 RepID=A0AA38XL08_9EURO|nr:hypothetical protein H2200_001499 [Cladophialophora chaetospira]